MIYLLVFAVLGLFHSEYIWLYLAAGLMVWFWSGRFAKTQPVGRLALVYFSLHLVQIIMILPYIKFGQFNPRDWPKLEHVPICLFFCLLQLSLMAVVVLKTIEGKSKFQFGEPNSLVDKINVTRVILFTFTITAVIAFLRSILGGNASILQLIMIASGFLQTAALIIVTLVIVAGKETGTKKYLAVSFMVIGFVLSFFSYFSSFRIYFLVVFLTVSFFGGNLIKKFWFPLSVLAVIGLFVLVFWSSVKNEYRALLSGGQKGQVVSIDRSSALGFLQKKVVNFDQKQFQHGFDQLLYRMQYLEIYTKVVDKVPRQMAHLKGDNLLSTIEFLFLPRVFDPDKRILDPSAKVNRFTNKRVTTARQGTSISMGYFADLYVDFGFLGMTPFLMLIAYLIGKTLVWIQTTYSYAPLLVLSFSCAFILNLGQFESDIDFYLGAIRNLMAFLLFMKLFISKKWITKWLLNGEVA